MTDKTVGRRISGGGTKSDSGCGGRCNDNNHSEAPIEGAGEREVEVRVSRSGGVYGRQTLWWMGKYGGGCGANMVVEGGGSSVGK